MLYDLECQPLSECALMMIQQRVKSGEYLVLKIRIYSSVYINYITMCKQWFFADWLVQHQLFMSSNIICYVEFCDNPGCSLRCSAFQSGVAAHFYYDVVLYLCIKIFVYSLVHWIGRYLIMFTCFSALSWGRLTRRDIKIESRTGVGVKELLLDNSADDWDLIGSRWHCYSGTTLHSFAQDVQNMWQSKTKPWLQNRVRTLW